MIFYIYNCLVLNNISKIRFRFQIPKFAFLKFKICLFFCYQC
ncbi:hypothetical protein HMPREF3226_01310 [Prevotella corporis]|uniref:Uncharacterized protein n=1 Tax=Prevotella corporis TaxID=28128 RepID=A0A133Q9C3_9BACT|nr:hypothetical protein HMPREF3226_01310 [Prevotella corporis]